MLFRIYRFVQRMKVETVKPFGKNIGEEELKISICDTNKDIAKVFSEVFAKEERVEILCGNILNLTASALVSPANSFGDMGGGVDKAIYDFFDGKAVIDQTLGRCVGEIGHIVLGVVGIRRNVRSGEANFY